LETEDITIAGRGKIDLGARQVDITLTPTLRDPGLASTVAHVKVAGSLADPTYTAVKRSAATSAVRHLLARATRPFRRWRAAMWGRGLPEAGPCAEALRRAERSGDP
jgi:hypothetical protein